MSTSSVFAGSGAAGRAPIAPSVSELDGRVAFRPGVAELLAHLRTRLERAAHPDAITEARVRNYYSSRGPADRLDWFALRHAHELVDVPNLVDDLVARAGRALAVHAAATVDLHTLQSGDAAPHPTTGAAIATPCHWRRDARGARVVLGARAPVTGGLILTVDPSTRDWTAVRGAAPVGGVIALSGRYTERPAPSSQLSARWCVSRGTSFANIGERVADMFAPDVGGPTGAMVAAALATFSEALPQLLRALLRAAPHSAGLTVDALLRFRLLGERTRAALVHGRRLRDYLIWSAGCPDAVE